MKETEPLLRPELNRLPPVSITWESISYCITERKGPPFRKVSSEKKLLEDVSGYCKPGQLLAILGSTGAGKVRGVFSFSGFHSLFLSYVYENSSNRVLFWMF